MVCNEPQRQSDAGLPIDMTSCSPAQGLQGDRPVLQAPAWLCLVYETDDQHPKLHLSAKLGNCRDLSVRMEVSLQSMSTSV